MRSIIIICLLSSVCYTTYSQTEKIEKENLNHKIKHGKLTAYKSKQLGDDWRKLINDMGGYPQFPYDSINNRIKYIYTIKIDDTKKGIYSKVIEWSTLRFGSMSKIIRYKDFETGRIFIDGHFTVLLKPGSIEKSHILRQVKAKKNCYMTFLFTVKEGKFRMEVKNIFYEYYFPEYNTESGFVPEKSIEVNMHSLYPITNSPNGAWKENLDLLLLTKKELYSFAVSLKGYIEANMENYNF